MIALPRPRTRSWLPATTSSPHFKHMLSSGTKAVPSSACLRCQLRCVLQRLRPLPTVPRRQYTAHRTFSTTYSRQAASNDEVTPPAKENASGVYFKHIGLNGRIVGKRGRKQRQTSHALATDSLGAKSEIVVFRDVVESRKKAVEQPKKLQDAHADSEAQGLKGLSLTAEEIQAAMSESGKAPDEEDVNKSIEALRPQAPVIEVQEFERLVKQLLDSYNLKQLTRYLRHALTSHENSVTVVRELEPKLEHKKRAAKRTMSFTQSRWQPGRTPLERRRISELPTPTTSRGGPSGPKARAADRIVRAAWAITTRLEEQRMGELEVEMTPWALALFFDVFSGGKPLYQTMIEPTILLRRSEIRPYRQDNIIRITARRQDAEDIATQLENKVLLMGKQVTQVDKLLRISGATYPKGNSLQHFRKQDLDDISRRTHSVFSQLSDGRIAIYSFKQSDRANARRLLLSLLDLPSHKISSIVLEASTEQQKKVKPESLALVPVFPDRGLHFRDRSRQLVRLTVPVRKETTSAKVNHRVFYNDQADTIDRVVQPSLRRFDRKAQEEPTRLSEPPSDTTSYWEGQSFTTSESWWVHTGLLLQESASNSQGLLMQDESVEVQDKPVSSTKSRKPVFWSHTPAYETLLSYFLPYIRRPSPSTEGFERTSQPLSERVARKSQIVAHFTPSPFSTRGAKALQLFPNLELTILRRFGGDNNEESELKVDGLCGIMGEQTIDIPLPDRVVDVRLSRKVSAYANISAVLADPQVQQFVAALQQSANSKGSLQGTPDVTFKMPGWMAETDDAVRKTQTKSIPEIEVPYVFERFEQVQSTGFRKNIEALDQRAEHSTAVRMFNRNFPRSARLRYKEIEAGDIAGRKTEIMFKVHATTPREETETSEALEPEADATPPPQKRTVSFKDAIVPALAVADFVTRACRSEITTWRGSSGLPREEKPPVRRHKHESYDKRKEVVETETEASIIAEST